jgi:hypothetical protein
MMPARLDEINGDPGVGLYGAISSDVLIQRLESPSFDPVAFLNESLSILPSATNQNPSKQKGAATQDRASQIQSLLAKLNAESIRYSEDLTQLTDEILRSGNRLAYEVEILRSDANNLHEVLTDTLQEDIRRFSRYSEAQQDGMESNRNEAESSATNGEDPEFISQLRMLSQVKARLDEVITVFGEAMEWPIAPSELSLTSSFISVSAPEPGSESHTKEEKAREVAKKKKSEVVSLLESSGGGYAGVQAASSKVDSLRSMLAVWKGTVEERPRSKFVDALAKIVEERRVALEARQEIPRQRRNSAGQRSSSVPGRPAPAQARVERNAAESSHAAGGLLRNLQRLRDEIYLD